MTDQPAAAAGVFTKNRVKAAPVLLCQRRLRNGAVQAVLVNSGNANACTGDAGLAAATAASLTAAKLLAMPASLLLPASTGVIGKPLPLDRIPTPSLPGLPSPSGGPNGAAQAIMTTDTFPKTSRIQGQIDGRTVTLAGIAKGAGMIHPDMATLLVFLFYRCGGGAQTP